MTNPIKIRIGRVVAIMVLVLFLCGITSLQAATLQLPKGSEVKVKFAPGIKISSGSLQPETPLLFTLAEPVMLGSKTLIEEGAQGTAKVVEVKKAGGGGKAGFIKIEFVDLETKGTYNTADGSKIKLTGTIEDEGKKSGAASIMRIILIGFLIKGGQGEIDTEQVYTAQVAESVVLESKE